MGTVGQDLKINSCKKESDHLRMLIPRAEAVKMNAVHQSAEAESLVFLSHFVMFYEGKLAAEAPGAGPGHGARGARRDQTRGGGPSRGFLPQFNTITGVRPGDS